MAKHPPAKMSAVLGRCRRTGRWRLGARSNVLAVLGSVRLDMRHSFVEGDEPDELKMKVLVLFGSAVLVLPEGAEVRPSGMSFLGTEWVDVPEHSLPSDLPTLEVEWTCVLGRVHVVTGSVLDKAAAPDTTVTEADTAGPEPAAGVEVEPASDIVVDMGMVDAEPWSMSDFATADPTPEPEPEPDPASESEPEPEPQPDPAPESEPEAPQLVEAWRNHDWGPGIVHGGDDDDAEDGGDAGESDTGPEPEPASQDGATPDDGPAPQLVEAWRNHDWGPGIVHRDDEDDDEAATAGAAV